jgi:molybdenum cofactor biosynthesis enzyme MoaA
MCVLPWMTIETSPLGRIRPCCIAKENIKNSDGSDMLLIDTTLTQAFNSEYMQDLRQQFLDGKKPDTCGRCWAEEQAGRNSKRINAYDVMQHYRKGIDFTDVNGGKLVYLDLKLGNICNLKCRICGSFSSSKWAAEELEINRENTFARNNLHDGRWPREVETEFWQDLESIFADIRYMEFTGGEPFLIDEHFDLLEKIVESGHSKKIKIHYNSNGTTFPSRGPDIWKNFGLLDIGLSIDDLGPRFEYQRYGAKWADVTENIIKLKQFKADNNNISLHFCITVNIQNFYNLDQTIRWLEDQQFDRIYINLLHDPQSFCIKSLPIEAKIIIKDKLSNAYISDTHRQTVDQLIDFMMLENDYNTKSQLLDIKNIDKKRNQNLSDHHPEVAEWIGYE